MKLDPATLRVDSFVPDQAPSALARAEQAALAATAERYCTLIGTCTTCDTYCICA